MAAYRQQRPKRSGRLFGLARLGHDSAGRHSFSDRPDEGHGFARPVNNMAMFASAEKLFGNHLGGRFQKSMTPVVAERLKALTVDVKTVEKPKR